MKNTHYQSNLVVDLIVLLIFVSVGLAGYFLHGMQTGMPSKKCHDVSLLVKKHPSLKPEIDKLTKKEIIGENQCEMLFVREAMVVNQNKTEGIY